MKKQALFSELRDFLILWGSQTVSTLGTAMTNFALVIWVYGQKGTASSITLLSVFSFLPSILFCFIAGTIADRWDKKRIMLLSDLLAVLGIVEAAVGVGTLVGSVLVTLAKPARSRIFVIFFSCGISFLLGDVGQSLARTLPFWIIASFASNLPLAFLGANLTAVMRTNIPIAMQGRVFAARDTLQFSTIPLGLFLGGWLADTVFEPFMASPNFLSAVFGVGKGSGIAVMFLLVGIIGCAASFLCLKNPAYRSLDS